MNLLARRYANAMFAVASEADAVDAVDADLARLADALADEGTRAAVMSPEVPRAALQRVIAKILGDHHELTGNLIGVVLRRRRESVLPDLSEAFRELVRESRGELAGTVVSARDVDADAIQELESRASKLAGKKVTLEVTVEPELIGGVRLRLGNTLYDGSVQTALEDLERRLMEVPL